MPSTTSLLTLLVLAATAAAPAAALAQDDGTTDPRTLDAVAVVAAPEVGKHTFAVYFRTDRALDRKANGRSLDGSVSLGAGPSSISTNRRGGKPNCYVGYVKKTNLRAPQHVTVRIGLGDGVSVTKRTTAVRPVEAVRDGRGIGC